MTKAMFERPGHFWVSFIQNKENGIWIEAENAKTAKYIFACRENISVSSYIVSSKKGIQHDTK